MNDYRPHLTYRPDPDEPRHTTEAPLRRALFLIENYLFNEDGEDEAWLEEARDIVKAELDARSRWPAT
jgi:hypothetical protein